MPGSSSTTATERLAGMEPRSAALAGLGAHSAKSEHRWKSGSTEFDRVARRRANGHWTKVVQGGLALSYGKRLRGQGLYWNRRSTISVLPAPCRFECT